MLSTTPGPTPPPPVGPLNAKELQRLTQAIRGLSHSQLVWASGYLAGVANDGSLPEAANDGPRLEGLRYAIFGFGDSSYEHFCQTAKDFDQRLHALGAERFQERIEADVDFQGIADTWMPTTLDRLGTLLPDREAEVVPLIRGSVPTPIDRNHPYRAEVLDNRRITTADAVSDVRHVAIGIDQASLSYTPGDSLGIRFRNNPALVDQILANTGLSGSTEIDLHGTGLPIAEALSNHLELTQLHPRVVAAWARVSGSQTLQSLSERADAVRRFAAERQFIDLVSEYPARPDATALADLLLPMQTRHYSIASSPAELDDEIHLSVSTLRYQAHGRHHLGGASGFIAERLTEGDPLDVYVAENLGFRLPEDGNTPILMIGTGTGIAPFRAFLQHRQALGHRGPNWLIPGFRHFHRDFLYQTDWLDWRRSGLLDRVSPAFSRDGDRRCYVQDRLRDEGAEVKRWLALGARIYVCGATAMELEVRRALTDIARIHGGLSDEDAWECVENLRAEGRYLRDVY